MLISLGLPHSRYRWHAKNPTALNETWGSPMHSRLLPSSEGLLVVRWDSETRRSVLSPISRWKDAAPDVPILKQSQGGVREVAIAIYEAFVDQCRALDLRFPPMATPSQLIGQTISHYRVLEKLGGWRGGGR